MGQVMPNEGGQRFLIHQAYQLARGKVAMCQGDTRQTTKAGRVWLGGTTPSDTGSGRSGQVAAQTTHGGGSDFPIRRAWREQTCHGFDESSSW